MEEGLFHNPTFVEYLNEYAVAVIGHQGQHGEIDRQNPLTGATEKVCPHYDTIPCEAHITSSNEARPNFDFQGVPATFVCDPSGKILTKDVPRTPQGTIDALTQAQQTIGKQPVTGSMILRWERDLYKGDAKLRQGKFRDALKAYEKVVENEDIPEFVRQRAEARVSGLAEAAMQAVTEASQMDARDAKRQLKKLIKEFKKMEYEDALAAAEAALAELDG